MSLHGPSDPALLILPPMDAFAKDYFIVSCNPLFTMHYITVIIKPTQAAGLLLNGIPFLGSITANQIPMTNFSAYQYPFKCGAQAQSFRISHPDITVMFGVTVYGDGTDNSYAYTAGRLLGPASPFCFNSADMNPPDHVDNDCDGWVDEEKRNFIDDDGDGLIDEDLAALIPQMNVTDSQLTSCQLSSPINPPPPVNGSDPPYPLVTVDPRCVPVNLTYNDSGAAIPLPCTALIMRKWILIDGCGNIADNVTQMITISRTPNNYTAPPTAHLLSNASLSDPIATGVPNATSSCTPVMPWNYTFVDAVVNQTYVNRTWTVNPQCGNASLQLHQDIYIGKNLQIILAP